MLRIANPIPCRDIPSHVHMIKHPVNFETEVYNIFGFEIVGDDMGYVICSDAFPEGSFSEFTEYEELPFENIAGSVSLEGEESFIIFHAWLSCSLLVT